MNRPNLASRNHCIFASCEAGAGAAACAMADGAQSVAAQIATVKVWANLVFTCVPRRFLIGAQAERNFNLRRPALWVVNRRETALWGGQSWLQPAFSRLLRLVFQFLPLSTVGVRPHHPSMHIIMLCQYS